jgi:hypothetical protein
MKPRIKLTVLLVFAALAPSAFAQTPLVRVVANHLAWLYSTEVAATTKCPDGLLSNHVCGNVPVSLRF